MWIKMKLIKQAILLASTKERMNENVLLIKHGNVSMYMLDII